MSASEFTSYENAVNKIAESTPLSYPSGKILNYGGVGMHIAGRIAEVVSGKTWDELFQEKIAGPCTMGTANYGTSNNPIVSGALRISASDYIKFLE